MLRVLTFISKAKWGILARSYSLHVKKQVRKRQVPMGSGGKAGRLAMVLQAAD